MPWYIAFAPVMVIFVVAYPYGRWWTWKTNRKRREQYRRRGR